VSGAECRPVKARRARRGWPLLRALPQGPGGVRVGKAGALQGSPIHPHPSGSSGPVPRAAVSCCCAPWLARSPAAACETMKVPADLQLGGRCWACSSPAVLECVECLRGDADASRGCMACSPLCYSKHHRLSHRGPHGLGSSKRCGASPVVALGRAAWPRRAAAGPAARLFCPPSKGEQAPRGSTAVRAAAAARGRRHGLAGHSAWLAARVAVPRRANALSARLLITPCCSARAAAAVPQVELEQRLEFAQRQ
jgi:hypothetical protein